MEIKDPQGETKINVPKVNFLICLYFAASQNMTNRLKIYAG